MIPTFDDAGSYVHTATGVLAACLGGSPAGLIALAFTMYQLLESERLENKIGDFIEFGLGFLATEALRRSPILQKED